MFTWRCANGHIRKEVAIGIDIEGDIWISFICDECKGEVMHAVKVPDMMTHAGYSGLNAADLAWLKEMHVQDAEPQQQGDSCS